MPRDTLQTRCYPNLIAAAEDAADRGGDSLPSPLEPSENRYGPQLSLESRKTLLAALEYYSEPLVRRGSWSFHSRPGPPGGAPGPPAAGSRTWCRTGCCSSREGGSPCVYIGRAGLDLALLQLRKQQMEEGVDGNTWWFIGDKEREGLPRHPRHSSDVSLCCGAAGVWYVLSMRDLHAAAAAGVPEAASATHAAAATIHTFFEFCNYAASYGESDEWLYGRAGLMAALLLLQHQLQLQQLQERHWPKQELLRLAAIAASITERMAQSVIDSGVRAAERENMTQPGGRAPRGGPPIAGAPQGAGGAPQGPPLRFFWHGEEYLGAAHGYFGILYMLLQVASIRKNKELPVHHKIRQTLSWLLSLESPEGNYPAAADEGGPQQVGAPAPYLVHFCHGAPGAVYLFGEAFLVYGDEVYRQAAERAAACTWRWGILKKGPGLCHGVAGNAYALLRWFQVSREVVWLQRAVWFGLELNEKRQKEKRADHPFSLFEGHAGVCCFLSDLLKDPNEAKMPLFAI